MEVDLNGVIANDKSRTTSYLAIVEAIVNSFQSIKETGVEGEVTVDLIRSQQIPIDKGENALAYIESVYITDNGAGFTKKNRESFGTLFSSYKNSIGGKGYGRITFLKHFENVQIDSTYKENNVSLRRRFTFQQGITNNNLDNEVEPTDNDTNKTIVRLSNIKSFASLDRTTETVSRKILEMLLPYFIDEKYKAPKVTIRSEKKEILLNDLVNNSNEIIEINRQSFSLSDLNKQTLNFTVVVCKIFFSTQSNRISLVAHNREVIETNLSEYSNEFSEPFIENDKTYTIKAYVLSEYLDKNVKHHRTGFNFGKSTPTLESQITQSDIEEKTCEIVKNTPQLSDKLETRTQAKIRKVQSFVDENPWHLRISEKIDYSTIPLSPSDQDIELALHKLQYEEETTTKKALTKIIESSSEIIPEQLEELVSSITEVSKEQLARYVAHRKLVIDLLSKSLQVNEQGKYEKESTVHNLIYPKNSDSKVCNWDDHNLWLLDERLTFTQYVTSEKRHVKESEDRSDILVFDKTLLYRSGDDAGNPVTVFELKRPHRFDFIHPESKDDPVEQVLRYCQQIKTNTINDTHGVTVKVHQNTPFYGYIISDINGDVENWLRLKDFRIMPDGKGWYYWHSSLNLYIEFIGWDKVYKDAEMRNRIFINKLGLK